MCLIMKHVLPSQWLGKAGLRVAPAIASQTNPGLIGLWRLTGTPPTSWLVANYNVSLMHMAIKPFMPAPMAGPVRVGSIMHKAKSIDF